MILRIIVIPDIIKEMIARMNVIPEGIEDSPQIALKRLCRIIITIENNMRAGIDNTNLLLLDLHDFSQFMYNLCFLFIKIVIVLTSVKTTNEC